MRAYCPIGIQFLILPPCDGNYLLLLFFFFRRILHSKGELSEDRHKQYEEFATSYQKLLANTQSLADLLDENMPELPQDKTVQEGVYQRRSLEVHISISSLFFSCVCVHPLLRLSDHGPGIDIFTPGKPGEYDLEGGIWEDEDARNFYENLVDLKAFVPAILFKDNEKSGQAKDREDAGAKGWSPRRLLARFYDHSPLVLFLLSRCHRSLQTPGRPRTPSLRSWSWSWRPWTSPMSPWRWKEVMRPRTRSWPRN